MNAQWMIALVGVGGTPAGALIGAIASGIVKYRLWKWQHQETFRAPADQELRDHRARAVDKPREVAGQMIELGTIVISGPHIDQTQLNTVTYMERLRLRRELAALINLTCSLFEENESRELLAIFQRMVSQARLHGQSGA